MSIENQERFKKLAVRRVNNAIKAINLIGNLSNRSNYSYADEDVVKIFKALQRELNACKKRFDIKSGSDDQDVFSL